MHLQQVSLGYSPFLAKEIFYHSEEVADRACRTAGALEEVNISFKLVQTCGIILISGGEILLGREVEHPEFAVEHHLLKEVSVTESKH